MKVKVVGHHISPSHRIYYPWWYEKIGQWIDVEEKLHWCEDLKRYVYISSNSENGYIDIEDVLTLNQIRLKKLNRILDDE